MDMRKVRELDCEEVRGIRGGRGVEQRDPRSRLRRGVYDPPREPEELGIEYGFAAVDHSYGTGGLVVHIRHGL